MKNIDFEKILREYYPENEYQIYFSEYKFKDSIHTVDFNENGVNLKLRFFSPQHKGDKSMIFYYSLN